MLRIVGRRFVIDHMLREHRREQEKETLIRYITDELFLHGRNKTHANKYSELVEAMRPERQEEAPDADEIKNTILEKARSMGKKRGDE